MKEKIKYIMSRKYFHICMTIIIIAIILFVSGIMILRYQVEGETNMPFEVTKITLISSSDTVDKNQNAEITNWAFDINQNNDIYIYIEKNSEYTEKEAIRNIKINNFNVEKVKEIGTVKFYRPNVLESGANFSNAQENEIQELDYTGGLEADLKNLVIGNQGGVIIFRYANNNVAEYVSDISTSNEIISNQLLKSSNVKEEDLKCKLTFDLSLSTEEGKEYKTNIALDLPIDGIVENGTSSKEITDLDNIIFKRTKN